MKLRADACHVKPRFDSQRELAALRQQWEADLMYLLLSLPVPGWFVTSTKALVVLLEAFWYVFLIIGGTAFLVFAGGAVIINE